MIQVCFGLHDADGKYSKFIGVAMASIFANTCAPVTIHILHDATLTNANRDKFSYLAGRYGQRVEFHNVERFCPNELALLNEKLSVVLGARYTIGAFYRLLIKEILQRQGITRAIYLDADIVVNLDIAQLWRQDLQNFPLAAIPEMIVSGGLMITNKFVLNAGIVSQENYFNSGVLLLDLRRLGENLFVDGVNFLVNHPDCECFDQDILNAFFSAGYLKLDKKFDSFIDMERRFNAPIANKIYHYAGHSLGLNQSDAYNRLWLKYFVQTPWFNLDALANLNEAFLKANDEHTLRIQQVMRLCVNCRRAFFIEPHNVDVTKILFNIRDDEQIIEFRVDDNSMNELLTAMHEQRGQTIFFICVNKYPPIGRHLLQNGFVEFQDFVSGMEFMTQPQCAVSFPLGYTFIRAL